MKLPIPLFPLMATLPLAGGCVFPTTACTDVALPSLIVGLRDAADGNALPVMSRVTAVGADHRDSVDVAANRSQYTFIEASVGPDTYTVTVRADGYETWTRGGVRVVGAKCHVETPTVITASLTRVSP
jgi:hypothetical protein